MGIAEHQRHGRGRICILISAPTISQMGLSIDPNTGIISGTIADDAVNTTPYEVSVTVDDGYSDQTTKTFWWTVNPALLTITQTFPISATEGTDTGTITLASFTTADMNSQAEDFSATVYWGDSDSELAMVVGSNGRFTVTDDHTYYARGNYPVSVVISNNNTATASATAYTLAAVSDAALTLTGGFQLGALANSETNLTVAGFTYDNAYADSSEFMATINWGDGSSTVIGSINPTFTGYYQISGDHAYTTVGDFTATVVLTAPDGTTQSTTSTIEVGNLYAGVAGSLTLASFTDTNSGTGAGSFTVSINWGDGNITSGAVTQSGSTFSITGNHKFTTDSISNTDGIYQVAVTVTGTDGTTLNTTIPVTVTRPPIGLTVANISSSPSGGSDRRFHRAGYL